jgi:hypothetical protein
MLLSLIWYFASLDEGWQAAGQRWLARDTSGAGLSERRLLPVNRGSRGAKNKGLKVGSSHSMPFARSVLHYRKKAIFKA